jgi:hypothetical protein
MTLKTIVECDQCHQQADVDLTVVGAYGPDGLPAGWFSVIPPETGVWALHFDAWACLKSYGRAQEAAGRHPLSGAQVTVRPTATVKAKP